jgi:hypothetical protein
MPDTPPTRGPGLRQQVMHTRAAAMRVIDAHVQLAKTELAPIVDNVKAVVVQAAVAIAFGLFAAILVSVGTSLFLGEWLFGSMGWGVVHGLLLSIAVILGCVWLILTADAGALVRNAAFSVLVGIALGIVFGLSLTNQAWAVLTDALNLGLPKEWRLLGVAAAVSAIAGAVIGAVVGAWRGGARSVLGGLVYGTLLGLLFGLFTAIAFGSQVGAALGVTCALVSFSLLIGLWLSRDGVDTEALKARFYPEQTIATTKETIEWLQEQAPMGPRS